MRIVFGVMIAVIVGACATPNLASSSAPANETAKVGVQLASTEAGEKKICRSMPVMGSNFPKRVCSTQAEWEAFDERSRESVDAYDKDRKAGNTQGGFESQ